MNDEDALRGLIGTIERTFGQDLDAWLACFGEPLVFITPAGTMTFPGHADARPTFEAQFAALRGAGFNATAADAVDIRVIGDDLALVDAHFTRRRADGSALEQLAALYVCRRRTGTEAWLVAALVRHPYGVNAIDPGPGRA